MFGCTLSKHFVFKNLLLVIKDWSCDQKNAKFSLISSAKHWQQQTFKQTCCIKIGFCALLSLGRTKLRTPEYQSKYVWTIFPRKLILSLIFLQKYCQISSWIASSHINCFVWHVSAKQKNEKKTSLANIWILMIVERLGFTIGKKSCLKVGCS